MVNLLLCIVICAALLCDLCQTRYFLAHTDLTEANPLLGTHTSALTDMLYFGGWMGASIALSILFPIWVYSIYCIVLGAVETWAIHDNIVNCGFHLAWPWAKSK